MQSRLKVVVIIVMGSAFYWLTWIWYHESGHRRYNEPPPIPVSLRRHLSPTDNRVTEKDRLSKILQEFTGSYPSIPTDKETATSAKFTEFQIVQGGTVYRVGDTLSVSIHAKDMRSRVKTQGGDFFRAMIYTERTKSSMPGRVRDYGNGTYGVTFPLLWEGQVTVKVRMIHSSSAVRVLKRLRKDFPTNRTKFLRRYMVGNKSSDGSCSVSRSDIQNPKGGGICDFSNSYAGVEWFCQRPNNVSCDQSVYHGFAGFLSEKKLGLTKEESIYFKTSRGQLLAVNSDIKANISTITVVKQQAAGAIAEQLPRCRPGLPGPVPSGYYHNGRWVSRVCRGPLVSAELDLKKCLQNKILNFLGDSTTRQWFEFIAGYLHMRRIRHPSFVHKTSGPLIAIAEEWNITARYQGHGPPINTWAWVNASVLSNLVRMIDDISEEPNHIVVLTVGFHFTSQPLAAYITRVRAVRAAILRLLHRQPETTVVIKPPNTASPGHILNIDDWASFQLYLILKEMFSWVPVVFVDAWEMTDGSLEEDHTHPGSGIVKEEILYLLSYICQ